MNIFQIICEALQIVGWLIILWCEILAIRILLSIRRKGIA